MVQKGEKDIIIVGLQTDKRINATVISGFEHGFNIAIPAYANSTIDNDYMESKKVICITMNSCGKDALQNVFR